MIRIISTLGAVAALSLSTGTAALADYTIMDDPALPSVVYIKFDKATLDRIALYSDSGQETADPAVITLDDGDTTAAVKSLNPDDAPRARAQPSAKSDNKSVEAETMDRFKAPTPDEIEKMIVEREIENRVFDQIELR